MASFDNQSTAPKKSLGQHWLSDIATLESIVDFAQIEPDDHVIEVGPGPGDLTALLVERCKKVTAVEFDPLWAEKLKKSSLDVDVVQADIRKFNFSAQDEYKVVANIPYYLTSHLVRILSEAPSPPTSFTLLIQKEVAERMAAKPGAMSMLSVISQLFGQVDLGPVVAPELFTPPPKVDSQVVRVVRHQNISDNSELIKLAKAGFANRRKKLSNSLAGSLHIDKSSVEEIIERSGLDKNVRAQELSLEDWHKLKEAIDDSK